jgi:hypothetical protein
MCGQNSADWKAAAEERSCRGVTNLSSGVSVFFCTLEQKRKGHPWEAIMSDANNV